MKGAAVSPRRRPLGPGAEVGSGTRLLLVRHAKAGDRRRAAGPDVLRPLSPPGRAQAAALVTSLWPLVAPAVDLEQAPARGRAGQLGDGAERGTGATASRPQPGTGRVRVYSSPARRCVDTVAPLAGALGVAVAEVPALGEGDAGAALAFVRGFLETVRAEEPEGEFAVTVACTHGDILPVTVAALVGEAGGPLPTAPPAAKASTWVLEWGPDGGLHQATYLAPPG